MDVNELDNQLKRIYSSSVSIKDVALKTCWERWTIETGSERGSGKSVLVARIDDDEEEEEEEEDTHYIRFDRTERKKIKYQHTNVKKVLWTWFTNL